MSKFFSVILSTLILTTIVLKKTITNTSYKLTNKSFMMLSELSLPCKNRTGFWFQSPYSRPLALEPLLQTPYSRLSTQTPYFRPSTSDCLLRCPTPDPLLQTLYSDALLQTPYSRLPTSASYSWSTLNTWKEGKDFIWLKRRRKANVWEDSSMAVRII